MIIPFNINGPYICELEIQNGGLFQNYFQKDVTIFGSNLGLLPEDFTQQEVIRYNWNLISLYPLITQDLP